MSRDLFSALSLLQYDRNHVTWLTRARAHVTFWNVFLHLPTRLQFIVAVQYRGIWCRVNRFHFQLSVSLHVPGNNFLISCPSHHDSWALVRYSCRASSWSAALLVYCSWTWTWTFRYREICFALLIVATHFCNSQWKIKLFNQWCTSHCDLIGSRGSTHAQKIFEVYLFVGHFLLKFMHNLRI